MISRIFLLLCTFAISSGILAQDKLMVVPRPQNIQNQMAQCGAQDQATSVLTILESKAGGYNSTTREITVVK